MIRYLGSLNSLEWNLTLKNENWTSLEKKVAQFSLRVRFYSLEWQFILKVSKNIL